jgi:uncharacterized protein (DUF488 family)
MPQLPTVYTIGHSTRSLDDLITALTAQDVGLLVDVRSVPRSGHVPQFNSEGLAEALPAAGIEYLHMKELGGWRKPSPASANMGWRNEGLRGYADYMETEEFAAAVQKLIVLASQKRAAIMCAEAQPHRCHRSLIADALTVRGVRVKHIIGAQRLEPHKVTPFALVDGERITYPEPA